MSERQFDKHKVRRWRGEVWRELRKAGLYPGPQLSAGMVLAAVAGFGTGLPVLQEITGLPEHFITQILRRLRKQRVLVGQKLRVAWDDPDEAAGFLAVVLDSMVATGELHRPPDETRSAAQKKAALTRKRTPNRQRKSIPDPTKPCRPEHTKSNPYYGLAEWYEPKNVGALDAVPRDPA